MIDQQWPIYSDANGNYITALPIKTVTQSQDGSGYAKFDGGLQDQYLSAHFFAVFHPVATGYIFKSQYGELLYLSKAAFEAKYTKSAGQSVAWGDITGKPTTFSPPAASSTVTGGVKQGVAVANSAATDVTGVNATLNALLASLRTAGVIAS